jgi:cellulose synthase/poly-beta-1,6-N-acetylglucosamine synthase-like glycosyltransferase
VPAPVAIEDLHPTLVGLFAAALGTYLLAIVWFVLGTRRKFPTITPTSSISIVVAARDESTTIDATLRALLFQSYDRGLYEVIIVDDGSTDDTLEKARSYLEVSDPTRESVALKILSTSDPTAESGSKKAALTLGIGAATGDIILSTDADCQVPVDWVTTMAAHFAPDVDAVVGFSHIVEAGLVAGVEALDFLLLMTAARGACGNGHPVAASGQSFGFRRSAFEEVGGYEQVRHRASGDDVLLLQLLRRAGKRIVFAYAPQAAVVHPAAASIGALLRQRVRWASNGPIQLRLDPALFLHLTATLLTSLGLVVASGLAIAGRLDSQLALAVWAVKALGDAVIILRGLQIFRRWDLFIFWPLWSLIHPIYLVVAGTLGCLGIFKWKGTSVRFGRGQNSTSGS